MYQTNTDLLGYPKRNSGIGETLLSFRPRYSDNDIYNHIESIDRSELFRLIMSCYKSRSRSRCDNHYYWINNKLLPINFKLLVKEYKKRYSNK